MTPDEICDALNANRIDGAAGRWVRPAREGEPYCYSENGVVGKGRWLNPDEAARIAVKLRKDQEPA